MIFHLGTRRLSGLLTIAILLVILGVGFVSPRLPAYAVAVWSDGMAAVKVLGQADFTSGTSSTTTASTLNLPWGVAVDPTSGKVFVADRNNCRVLRFASQASLSNGANAEGVLGQTNFTTGGGGASQTKMSCGLGGVAVGSDGTLWVADSISHRVLRFTNAASKLDGDPADGVLGQPDFTTVSAGASSTKMTFPYGVAVDSSGTLWVADSGNNRVLRFPGAGSLSPGAPADGVLGQLNFTTVSAGTSSTTMNSPRWVAVGSNGALWVADTLNNRVLLFDPNPSNNANLSALALSSGTLSPTFAAGTTSYTATVANSVGTLTLTPTVSEAHATVKVNGVTATSGSAATISGLIVGTNTITVEVTAQDPTITKTYTVTVTRNSNNADPSALALSSGTLSPTFDVGTFVYTASVDNSVTSFTVSSSTSEGHATITVNGHSADTPVVLAVGENTITIVVTAQDGTTTKTYTVTVTRAASSNADLSALALSDGTLSPTFAAGTTTYTASVANSVNSLTVTPTVSETHATVAVSGTLVTSGSASGSITLAVGDNVIPVRVTAQDGTTTKTYTVTVTRNSNNADPSTLALSVGTLVPAFDVGTFVYTASVGNSVTSFTVSSSASEGHATITVNGHSADTPVVLAVGANTITIVVTAQDGTTTKTYTITVTRTASNNADLSALALSDGTLSPAFAAGTTNYSATVANSVQSLTVTPTVSDTTATVTVNDGSAASAVSLNVGANTITIIVTAQDGTPQTYTVTVTRASASASSNADLSGLTLSGVTLSPSFATGIFSYSATVANSVSSLTVTPSASTANASITVNGSSAASAVHLSVGANRITIVVTAQDGTTKTYTVTVTRIGEADVEITQSYALVKEPTKTGPLTTLAALTNTLSLTITVYNHGPDAVTGVVVTDSFPEATVGTVWTWTCVGAGGGVCGNANGTGNLNETLGLLPKDGSVTFVVTGSLLNPNNWRNTPGLVTPTGVVNTSSGNSPVIVGHFLIFAPIVMR